VRALIVGAGAIGQYVAAQLKLAGHDAVLLAKPDAAARLRDGYVLVVGDKTQRVVVPAITGTDDGARGDFDLVVTAVKSFATASAIESIRALPACDRAAILVLQNGLGNEELCAAAFGDDRVVAGALTTAVDRAPEPGVIAAKKGGVTIAPVGAPAHNWIIAAFELSAIKVAAAADWRALKWSKLCTNLLANAVCAILDWTPAQVYADTTAFDVERRCLLEAIATMDKLGLAPISLIDFPVPLLVAAARSLPPGMLRVVLASRVARARGDKLPSLLIDARARRAQTEVDALNGAVAARAAASGIAAPANAMVARVLDGITAGTIPWDDFRAKPSALAAAILSARA